MCTLRSGRTMVCLLFMVICVQVCFLFFFFNFLIFLNFILFLNFTILY